MRQVTDRGSLISSAVRGAGEKGFAGPHRPLTYSFRQRTNGFSLVELVTVMVIAGILAAFAAPRFFSANTFAARGYYEDALAALRYAHKFAIVSRCTVTATFTAGTGPAGGYALTRAGCPGTSAAGSVARPDGTNFSNSPPSGVTVTGAAVVFDDVGRTTATTAITISTRTITVENQTGFVH